MHSSEIIGWFADIGLSDRPTVGGKGGSLGELTRASIPVPPGFVVRTAAFERFLSALEEARANPAEGRSARRASARRDHRTFRTPARARGKRAAAGRSEFRILAAHAELCGGDNDRTSWQCAHLPPPRMRQTPVLQALQDTYLWVIGAQETLKYVRSCWASLYSVPSIAYRRKHGLPESGVAMAVVVQRMVNAHKAGVMFTRSPLTGDRSVITIEGAWGLGFAVVSGEVTPDRFVIAKITGEISVRDISDKHVQHLPAPTGGVTEVETPEHLRRAPCLSDAEIVALRDIARRVERHYGRPQDIEWAIDHFGDILLLQSRPETVWSSKDRAPVAKPAENPLQHVMKIFGGRR